MVQSVRRTRSRRMKFCVQGGLGALPQASKAEGKITAGFFPLRAECINTGIASQITPNSDKYYKQFDKYFIFVEQAIRKTKDAGYICYIVPNKFFKVGAGEHLRSLIAKGRYLVSLDDFGDAQLFEDKTIYSSILLLCKSPQEKFRYTGVDSADKLWVGEEVSSIEFGSSILNKLRMAITQGRDGSKSYLSLFIITANNPFNPKQLRSAIAVSVFVLGK